MSRIVQVDANWMRQLKEYLHADERYVAEVDTLTGTKTAQVMFTLGGKRLLFVERPK